MKATARDMRYHLRSVMEAVQRGEDVYVTNRGRVTAKLVPVAGSAPPRSEGDNPFVGMWKDREELQDVRAYVRRIRKGRFS